MELNWSSILSSADVNFCLNEFIRLFGLALEKVAPFRDVRVRSKSNPWMNHHILSGIRLRDSLLSRYKRDRSNQTLFSDYCRVRNQVQRDNKFAKNSYFSNLIESNKGDSKKLWGRLRSLEYKSTHASSGIVLEQNGSKVFDSYDVATLFNRFYVSVASDLVAKLPSVSGLFSTTSFAFRHFYRRFSGLSHSFTLSLVSRHFVLKQLQSLNPNKAVGLDGISSKFLRDACDTIVEPVCHIINLSIITEVVPNGFKQAKVIPLFKKGSKLDPGNYRPVSVLNVFSKVLERAVHNQLNEYLEKKSILYHKQSGFRSRFSTDSCLIGLTDYVKSEVKRGNFVGMILIDLAKAFDTVDHDVLLSKLEAVGVTSVSWFRSYLSDREQCVEVNGVRSDFLPITCGVPQGSILWPQLFLLYINDMCTSVECDLSLYADDSALIYSHSDPYFIARHLNAQLASCKTWLIDNRLSLHVGKTESILFGSSRKLKRVDNYQVTCEGTPVKRVTEVTYLGLLLNDTLDGKSHAERTIKKSGTRLSFLYRNSAILDGRSRKSLCISLIQPYLDYCCSSWYSGLTQRLKSKLDALQRRMIRFIFSLHHLEHIGLRFFAELSWLTFADRVAYFKLCHMFKVKMRSAPQYMSNNFTPVASTHSHSTRGSVSCNFSVTRPMSLAQDSFSFSAMKEWNSLPSDLKCISSESIFRTRVKKYFMEKYTST